MIKKIFPLFILFFSTQALGSDFILNYKNINTLAALICYETAPPLKDESEVLLSTFSADHTRWGPSAKQFRVELSGICNTTVSQGSSEVQIIGQELLLKIDAENIQSSLGSLGISTLEFKFQEDFIQSIIIKKLDGTHRKTITLSDTKWAKTDSVFNLDNSKKIIVKKKEKAIAKEGSSLLEFKNGYVFHNIWSFESFGCLSKNSMTLKRCEILTNDIL